VPSLSGTPHAGLSGAAVVRQPLLDLSVSWSTSLREFSSRRENQIGRASFNYPNLV